MREIVKKYPSPSHVDMDIEQFTKLMYELKDIADGSPQPGTRGFDRFCKLIVICEQYQLENMIVPGMMLGKEELDQKYIQ